MAGFAAASVVAFSDADVARRLQGVFHSGLFRVYTNHDVVGCELGGALKNVIAIASGMGDGLGVGDNTRAAVITRGLAELKRLGVAMGGEPATFSGLTGMGDLVATCTSRHSRNRRLGELIGRGLGLDAARAEVVQVVEGVETTKTVNEMARREGISMPIAEQVGLVLFAGREPAVAIEELMSRALKAEWGDGES